MKGTARRASVLAAVLVAAVLVVPPYAGASSIPFPTRIAFSRTSNGTHIFTTQPDGSELTQLTFGKAVDTNPAWSLDGSSIAFTRTTDAGSDIDLMAADGSGIATLIADASFPAYMLDTGRIAFQRTTGGNTDVWIADADGSNQQRLTNAGAVDRSPSWAMDGGVLFSSARTGRPQIFEIGQDGGGLTRVTHDRFADREPEWNPFGWSIGEVVFRRDRHGSATVFAIDTSSDMTTRLIPNTELDAGLAASYGGPLLVSVRDPDGSIHLQSAPLSDWFNGTPLPLSPVTTGAHVHDRDPAAVPAPAWHHAEDLQARADLTEALDAAKAFAADHGDDFSGANQLPSGLVTKDAGLCYVAGTTASVSSGATCVSGSGDASVSVLASTNEWAAARMSASGSCQWIDFDATGPTTTYDVNATCTGNAAVAASQSSWP